MSGSMKTHIILPVAGTYIIFSTIQIVIARYRLSDIVPAPLARSLCFYFCIGTAACLTVILLILVKMLGKNDRMMDTVLKKIEETGHGHIRTNPANQSAKIEGAVGSAIDRMSNHLDQSLSKIIVASGRIHGSTVNLQTVSEECASTASHQQNQAQTIATAAEEMSHTIVTIAENATTANETSQNALKIVSEGKEIAGHVVEAASLVESSTGALADSIERLRKRVMEIEDIVAVIDEIADQTNLLALNAAIEAARSGEHGRGFAVVADEVRNLAARTIRATAEISGKIIAVQQETTNTSSSMQESLLQVRSARSKIGEMEDSLFRITSSFETVNNQIAQIATTVDQQAITTQQISASIEETSRMSGTLSSASSQVKEETNLLASITDELLLVLGSFHLGAHYNAANVIEKTAANDKIVSMNRGLQEQEMMTTAKRHPYVELLYITDIDGHQITSNISASGSTLSTSYGNDGFGMDWSNRPWFRGARDSSATYISELYRSVATGSFCCTIAVPIRAQNGTLVAVLGADISITMLSNSG